MIDNEISNKSMVERFYIDIFKKRELNNSNEFIDDNYINHSSFVGNGRVNFEEYFNKAYKLFPKGDANIKHVIINNDMVVVHAEHWASNMIFKVRFKAIDVYRVENGLIVEHWDSLQGMNSLSILFFLCKSFFKL
ncbi:nuclear transport factor 2 family protein [Vibrio echinoideorum]|uniref:nuclear transport factor 2 family protein n=1 Tax=Vibrio echinoideorum TaxID=2100116 RepID=UPI0035536247